MIPNGMGSDQDQTEDELKSRWRLLNRFKEESRCAYQKYFIEKS